MAAPFLFHSLITYLQPEGHGQLLAELAARRIGYDVMYGLK